MQKMKWAEGGQGGIGGGLLSGCRARDCHTGTVGKLPSAHHIGWKTWLKKITSGRVHRSALLKSLAEVLTQKLVVWVKS